MEVEDQYEELRTVGRGASATATLVRDRRTGRLWVMKKVDLGKVGPTQQRLAFGEARALGRLCHPNVISLHKAYLVQDTLHLVLEYADGGDLGQCIAAGNVRGIAYQEDQILKWLVQLALGLQHVHAAKILHRDIKPQNIFLTKDGIVKLGDFGISRELSSTAELASTCVGTPFQCAPEILKGQSYSYACDVWSLGVVLYELITLQLPFKADNIHALARAILEDEAAALPHEYSEDLQDLVIWMLTKDPATRPSIDSVLALPLMRPYVEWAASQVEKVHLSRLRTDPITLDNNDPKRSPMALQFLPARHRTNSDAAMCTLWDSDSDEESAPPKPVESRGPRIHQLQGPTRDEEDDEPHFTPRGSLSLRTSRHTEQDDKDDMGDTDVISYDETHTSGTIVPLALPPSPGGPITLVSRVSSTTSEAPQPEPLPSPVRDYLVAKDQAFWDNVESEFEQDSAAAGSDGSGSNLDLFRLASMPLDEATSSDMSSLDSLLALANTDIHAFEQ